MPALNLYDAGDSADLAYDYVNASGAHINPSSIAAVAISPAGSTIALSPTRVATGSYEASVELDSPGRWLSRWTATGVVNDSETIALVVRPNAPVRADDAYATVDDVVRLAQGRTFTASSRPAVSDVVDWLNLSAAEINGLLRRMGYEVPVPTGATGALALLAHGNALGAACMVETAAPVPNRTSMACKLYDTFKKSVLSGDLELDAAKDAANSAPRSNASNQATAMIARSMFEPLSPFGDT